MRGASILFRRELLAYLRSPAGWIIAALVLLIDGIMFQSLALGAGKKLSGVVLSQFFYYTYGLTGVAAVLLSVRLFAEERQLGTMVLLNTSPVRDAAVVAGKFLSALVFLTGIVALTFYMPLLVSVNGKIALGQVLVGYLGLVLAGAAFLAVGMFASALARQQLVAAVVGGALAGLLYLLHFLSNVVEPPLKAIIADLSLNHQRFRPFMNGTLQLEQVVFYLAVAYFFLLLTVKTLEAKRWQ